MTEYTQAIATATRLIAKKGELCTWRQFDIDNGDQDWNETSAGFTDYPVRIVFLPYGRTVAALLAQLNGTTVERLSLYGLMAPVPFTPKLRDLIISVRGELRPVTMDILQPADEVVLYTLGIEA